MLHTLCPRQVMTRGDERTTVELPYNYMYFWLPSWVFLVSIVCITSILEPLRVLIFLTFCSCSHVQLLALALHLLSTNWIMMMMMMKSYRVEPSGHKTVRESWVLTCRIRTRTPQMGTSGSCQRVPTRGPRSAERHPDNCARRRHCQTEVDDAAKPRRQLRLTAAAALRKSRMTLTNINVKNLRV